MEMPHSRRMIPRIIHQLWVQGIPIPDQIAQMMGTWQWFHPRWEYRFWHAGNMIELQNKDLWDRAAEISPKAPEQFRSDVARYEILFHYGGVWVDADFVCHKPIDDLIGVPAFAGRETRQWLNNALIGATPGHPMLFDLIAGLPANVGRCKPLDGNTVKSGPQYFTPAARRHQITEYPQRFFYPYLWDELDRGSEEFPDAYATHHWQNQRRIQGKPLVTV